MNDRHDPTKATPELDRRLAGYLGDDVPARAPEHAIEGALAHARAHPRRRDVFAAVRPDPMDGYAGTLGLAGGPGGAAGAGSLGRAGGRVGGRVGRGMPRLSMVVALGLVLVAAFAVASVGGVFDRPSLVPPDASPSPSVPSPSVPSPSMPLRPETVRVDLIELYGLDAAVDIVDESGTMMSAVSGTPLDGGSTDGQSVVVTQGGSSRSVVLTWTGLGCHALHTLVLDADGHTGRMVRTACDGDTYPRDLVLELTFATPVAPDDLDITLETVVP